MPKESKFKVGDIVTVKGEEGTVEEICATLSGGFQYRVRIDLEDSWNPEKDIEEKKTVKAPVVPGS